eukprot:COSAG02_NODE_977_length_15502_cov_235.762838_16_plen_55_part_00
MLTAKQVDPLTPRTCRRLWHWLKKVRSQSSLTIFASEENNHVQSLAGCLSKRLY